MVIEPVGSATEQLAAAELSTAAAAVSALLPKMVAAEAAASSQLASNATTTAWEFGWKRNETGCDTKDIPAPVCGPVLVAGNSMDFAFIDEACAKLVFPGALLRLATAWCRRQQQQRRLVPSFLGPIGECSAALAVSPLVAIPPSASDGGPCSRALPMPSRSSAPPHSAARRHGLSDSFVAQSPLVKIACS